MKHAVLVILLFIVVGCSTTESRKVKFVKSNDARIGEPLPLYWHQIASEVIELEPEIRRFVYDETPEFQCIYFIDLDLKTWTVSRWGYLKGKADCEAPKTNWRGPW